MSAEVLAEAIKLIGDVVSRVKSRRQKAGMGAAADALTVIGAIVESVQGGQLDKVTADEARDELSRLRRALDEGDAAADRALEKKFDTTGED